MDWLHVDGKHIKDRWGRTARLRGVNTVYYETWAYHNPKEKVYSPTLATLGANVIRLAVGTNNFPAYKSEFDWMIQWCKQRNIRIIWDCHIIGDTPDNIRPNNVWNDLTLREEWITWLENVAQTYINEPCVCGIDLLNEPPNAELNTPETFQTWVDAATEAIDRIHAINPNLLIFIQGIGAEWWWGSRPFQRQPFINRPNCVFSTHLYPNLTFYKQYELWGDHPWIKDYIDGNFDAGWMGMQNYLENVSDNKLSFLGEHPIFVGEIGLEYTRLESGMALSQGYTPFPNAWQVWLDLIRFFNKHGIHYAQWAADWGEVWGIVNEDLTPRSIYNILQQEFAVTPTPPILATVGGIVIGGGIGYVLNRKKPVVPIIVGAVAGGIVGFIIDCLLQ